jgi:hypothetical protein
MPHSFSNCPLRSSCLLITHHSTQCIVTATDEVLDLLGYSLSDLVGHSIHALSFQLSSQLSFIPECTIKHANGEILNFQVCVHQDPLGASSCLDYWLIRPSSSSSSSSSSANNIAITAAAQAAISVIRLSPYGTIEQVQPSPNLKQPISELIGRPVMAFVYQDDVEPLCASLSKICSIHKHQIGAVDPLFIRWSKLPCLISNMADYESSLNYDWMSFTMMAAAVANSNTNTAIRPICILRPLQVEEEEQEQELIVIHDSSVFNQLIDYCKFICNNMKKTMEESATQGKLYLTEFYRHIVSSLLEMISALIYSSTQQQQQCNYYSSSIQQNLLFQMTKIQQEEKEDPQKASPSGFIWDLIKSNYILQRSLNILEFTTGLQPSHFKSCMETSATT